MHKQRKMGQFRLSLFAVFFRRWDLPVPIIARTMDVARRMGDGRSIGYVVPSGSLDFFVGATVLVSDDVVTAESTLSSSLGLEKIDVPCLIIEPFS
jgi:hypothetical protein